MTLLIAEGELRPHGFSPRLWKYYAAATFVVGGALFLDVHHALSSAWIQEIDLKTLDMDPQSSANGILGQLYGSYEKGLERLRLLEPANLSGRLGFVAQESPADALTEAWRDIIVMRQRIAIVKSY